MRKGEIMEFGVCTIVACIYVLIGVSAYRSKEAVGFFTFVKPPEIKKDKIKPYNHAVAKLWWGFAMGIEIIGIPLVFLEQNSPLFALVAVGAVILVIVFIGSYLRIERKYRS